MSINGNEIMMSSENRTELESLAPKFQEGMSDFDIEQLVQAAEDAQPEGVIDMRSIKDSVEVDENAELETAEIATPIEKSEIDIIAEEFEEAANRTTDISLFDIGDADAEAETIANQANNEMKKAFDLTDEEAYTLFEVIGNMRKDPNYPVFPNLPEKVQNLISKMAFDNKVPVSQLNTISRMLLQEFVNDAGVDKALIDLEKALDEALEMPSLLDLYSDHTREVMDTIIPQTIEKIADEAPEQAEKLSQIRTVFKQSYDFSRAKEAYENNARLRKTIRRWESELGHVLDKFNFMNDKSNFKMNDVREVPNVLAKILQDDPKLAEKMFNENGDEIPENIQRILDLDVSTEDIHKFCILICKHCENLDPNDVIDAAYMYYLIRNIIALKHTKEAKTDFAVELINNVCDTITFIRDKEDEFNAANMDKSKPSKKLREDKRNSKKRIIYGFKAYKNE